MKNERYLAVFLRLILTIVAMTLQHIVVAQDFSGQELALIKKANTSRFAFYLSRKMKEFIRLMNLARVDLLLCEKYLLVKHGADSSEAAILRRFSYKDPVEMLKPGFSLHLAAWGHALASGWKGTTGHQAFMFRVRFYFNFSRTAYGENCEYGSKKAADIFLSLFHSPPHRSNILSGSFTRVGVSKHWHNRYGVNTVTDFGGPGIWRKLFKRKKHNSRSPLQNGQIVLSGGD